MAKLTAVIIAKNEEDKIAKTIKTLKWSDEVLVLVDKTTTDKTAMVSRKAGARVVKISETGYGVLRNKARQHAKNEWIFYLDADEECTPALAKEIKELIRTKVGTKVAYAVPRRNFIWGKEFKHCGQWPDYQKRLFLKNKLQRWEGEVHEEPVFSGKLGHLKNPMIHKQDRTLKEMVDKTNGWSEIEAKLMLAANHPPVNVLRFLSAMLREFSKRMFKQLAFLDGPKGIIYALYQVFSRFVSYAKLWEMQVTKK